MFVITDTLKLCNDTYWITPKSNAESRNTKSILHMKLNSKQPSYIDLNGESAHFVAST